jgi:hypothetical protein
MKNETEMKGDEIRIIACLCLGFLSIGLLFYFVSKNTLAPWAVQGPPPPDSNTKTGCSKTIDVDGANCPPQDMVKYCNQTNLPTEDRRRCDEFCGELRVDNNGGVRCEYALYCGTLDSVYISQCVSPKCSEDVAKYDPENPGDEWCTSPENPCYADRQPTKSQLTHCTPGDMSVLCVLTQDNSVQQMCREYCAESSYTCSWIYDSDDNREMLNTFCPAYIDKEVCAEQQRARIGV